MDPGICKLITSSRVRLVRASRSGWNTQKTLIKRWGAITCPKRASEWQLKSVHLGLWIHGNGSFFLRACQRRMILFCVAESLGTPPPFFGFPSSNWNPLFSDGCGTELNSSESLFSFWYGWSNLYLRSLVFLISSHFHFHQTRRREGEKPILSLISMCGWSVDYILADVAAIGEQMVLFCVPF